MTNLGFDCKFALRQFYACSLTPKLLTFPLVSTATSCLLPLLLTNFSRPGSYVSTIIPIYPDAPTSSKQLVYSSPQFLQPKILHLIWRTPIVPKNQHRSIPFHLLLALSNPKLPIPDSLRGETYLIKIKHQIQFTHIPKKAIQHLDEKMDRL